ncbi:HK97 family phage prohead protease [Sanguibacter massiliensis]|uniref:HK97 family phage prohead protease n=1 Tax=Sanguibacter massiliensis TaxID=1973217 RepID=UPI000C836F39|nr:HK97 family phage prohead protease [Sanguibacter massiliensis]
MPEQLLTRAFEVRSADLDERTVTGIAVPWDTPVKIRDWWTDGTYLEQVARGAVVESDDAKLFADHAAIIGRVVSHRDTDEGWEITAKISETSRGNDVYTLLRDGALDRFSIGFQPLEHVESRDADDVLTITRTKIRVREVSVVPFPAYDTAKVSSVRSATSKENTPMPESTPTPDVALRESVEDLARQVELIRSEGLRPAAEATPTFRSIGDMVKRVAAGDEAAVRAYTGAVSGDAVLKDAWIGDLVEIIKKRRPVMSTFATGALPATGMGVEYAVLESDSTQVGVQADEGDDLLFGKVSITTKTAPIVTLGGWSSLSRQTIERSTVGILDTTFEAMVERYARASEVYVRKVLTDALAVTGSDALDEVTADLTTQDGIVTAVLDLVEHFDDAGRALDGVFVDKATFLALYAVPATDRVLQVTGAPADKVGTITVNTGAGDVAGLTFRLLPGADAGTVVAYDRTAIKTLESPGAPVRLQDENIVNLTKDFSIYGYLAAVLQKPEGLVKVVDTP